MKKCQLCEGAHSESKCPSISIDGEPNNANAAAPKQHRKPGSPMSLKRAHSIINAERGRGRPTAEMSALIAQAKAVIEANGSGKPVKNIEKNKPQVVKGAMSLKRALSIVNADRPRGRPTAEMSALIAQAKAVIEASQGGAKKPAKVATPTPKAAKPAKVASGEMSLKRALSIVNADRPRGRPTAEMSALIAQAKAVIEASKGGAKPAKAKAAKAQPEKAGPTVREALNIIKKALAEVA